MKPGDKIIVTEGTLTAVAHGWVGKIVTIVEVTNDTSLSFLATDGNRTFWVDGVKSTPLIEELY